MTLSKIIDEYLLEHQIQGHSPATIRYYRQNLTWFCDFLQNPDISTVTLQRTREYMIQLRERNTSSTTLQTYTRAIRAFLTWCYNESYTTENIPAKLKLPKATRKAVDILTDPEISRLLNCINTKKFIGLRDMVVVLLMLDSGMRLSEVIRLEHGKIHLESGYLIAHGKGNKERYIPLGLNTRKYLLKYIARLPNHNADTALIVKDTIMPATHDTIRQLFNRLKIRSQIPRLHPHLLRHTFATRYLSHGGDVYRLQAILGHTTLEMTKRYVTLIPREMVVNFSNYSPIDNLKKNPRNGL
jgi:integrase/recombinase XerC/integrase/recombinase XerD